MLLNFFTHQIILKNASRFPQKSVLITINVSKAANQHIRIISERSRDTKDSSNDAENLNIK